MIEAFKVNDAEELRIGLFSNENKEMKKEVHLCKVEVNALTKRVENSEHLQKATSSAWRQPIRKRES